MRGHTYEPSFSSFFPRTNRGHGSAHARIFLTQNPDKTTRANMNKAWHCVEPMCGKSKAHQHEDKAGNIKAWKAERGIK